ncbi:MAG: DDE-type integrase/transposase/recombinase [Nanoarchaeota archaeon]
MKNNTICPKCESEDTIKWTQRKTENRGLIQRYKCKSCSKTFVLDEGFFRMRNHPQKITQSIDLFFRGVSTRKVQEHLGVFYPHNASHKSIYLWIVKYSKIISKFTEKMKVNVGEEVQVDEMQCFRRRSHKQKRGVEEDWHIDSICPETKFMVFGNYVKSRGKKQIRKVFEQIKEKSRNKVKVITTDGLFVYPNQIRKVCGWNNITQCCNISHNKVNASKGEGFNNPIERLHNSMRHRLKTMRGFHGSMESANSIMKGWGIYYNFITKHQAIDCCPYELVMPEFAETLKEIKNKWHGLIYLSKEADL